MSRAFWSRVEYHDDVAACWHWRGTMGAGGYGRFAGRPAHHVSFEAVNGPVVAGMVVRHCCDNRACVNPRHLMLGTHLDNSWDQHRSAAALELLADAHDRKAPRARAPYTSWVPRRAKIVAHDLLAAAVRRDAGLGGASVGALAKAYSVSVSTVRQILDGTGCYRGMA